MTLYDNMILHVTNSMTIMNEVMIFNVVIEITIYYCVKTYFKTCISVDTTIIV